MYYKDYPGLQILIRCLEQLPNQPEELQDVHNLVVAGRISAATALALNYVKTYNMPSNPQISEAENPRESLDKYCAKMIEHARLIINQACPFDPILQNAVSKITECLLTQASAAIGGPEFNTIFDPVKELRDCVTQSQGISPSGFRARPHLTRIFDYSISKRPPFFTKIQWQSVPNDTYNKLFNAAYHAFSRKDYANAMKELTAYVISVLKNNPAYQQSTGSIPNYAVPNAITVKPFYALMTGVAAPSIGASRPKDLYKKPLLGNVYIGAWNADLNVPILSNECPVPAGYVYSVTTGGSQFGTLFLCGDAVGYDGFKWVLISVPTRSKLIQATDFLCSVIEKTSATAIYKAFENFTNYIEQKKIGPLLEAVRLCYANPQIFPEFTETFITHLRCCLNSDSSIEGPKKFYAKIITAITEHQNQKLEDQTQEINNQLRQHIMRVTKDIFGPFHKPSIDAYAYNPYTGEKRSAEDIRNDPYMKEAK